MLLEGLMQLLIARGVLTAEAGMLLAIVGTFLRIEGNYEWIVAALVLGAGPG